MYTKIVWEKKIHLWRLKQKSFQCKDHHKKKWNEKWRKEQRCSWLKELGKSDRKEKIRQLRDESVANFGCAAKDAVNELLRIRDELKNKQGA